MKKRHVSYALLLGLCLFLSTAGMKCTTGAEEDHRQDKVPEDIEPTKNP